MLDYDFSFFPAIESILKRINQCFWKHFAEYHSSTCFLIFRNWKRRLSKRYLFDLFTTIVWKNSCILALLLRRIPIKKWVQWVTMTMDVNDERDRVEFVQREEEFFDEVNLAVIVLSRLPPDSIQIVAWKISTVVAIEDTICVHHWDHVKLITFFPALEITLKYPLYYSLSDIWSLRFSWMLSCHKNNTWSSLLIPF